jgi:hypothetical protein
LPGVKRRGKYARRLEIIQTPDHILNPSDGLRLAAAAKRLVKLSIPGFRFRGYSLLYGNSDLLGYWGAGRSGVARKESVPQDAPKRADPIFPGDFLPLCIDPSVVRDRYLIHRPAPSGDLDGYFLLETEAVLFQVKSQDNIPPQGFVTGPHIGEV